MVHVSSQISTRVVMSSHQKVLENVFISEGSAPAGQDFLAAPTVPTKLSTYSAEKQCCSAEKKSRCTSHHDRACRIFGA